MKLARLICAHGTLLTPRRSREQGTTMAELAIRRSRGSSRSFVYGSIFFVLCGYFTLTSSAGTAAYMGRQGLPAPALLAALAVIIELGGGLGDPVRLSDSPRDARLRDLCTDRGDYRSSQFRRP